ncbi:MAG: dihydrodipicolinate synthase family protein [Chitinispirillaceae bacterium]
MTRHKTHVSYKAGSRRAAEEIVAQIVCNRFASPASPVILAVGGPGGTGKSTFCNRLATIIPDCSILHLDDYKTPRAVRSRSNLFGAHPKANRMDLVRQHTQYTKAGEAFDKPVYDATTGRADTTEFFSPGSYVILDGEISTYEQFRDLVDFSIFIDSDWRTQLATRCSRDIEVRGYSREKAISTFLQSNLREFQEFGAHSKMWADMHLYCRDDYHMVVESMTEELFQSYGSALAADLMKVDLSGLIVPVCVPFDFAGRIDEKSFIAHLSFLARNDIHRVLINGTTGEFFSLTQKERRRLLIIARQYFPGVILFQAGCSVLADSIQQAKWGQDYGADAVVCLPPFYFAHAPGQGIVEYLNTVADAIDIPFILYNFPRHTQNGLTADILQSIRHFGLKDSSADLSLIDSTKHYYIGDDRLIQQANAKGAYGFISGQANHAPRIYHAMEKALKAQDTRQVTRLQDTISGISQLFTGPEQIALIKYAVSKRVPNFPSSVRLPLRSLTAKQIAQVDSFCNEIR